MNWLALIKVERWMQVEDFFFGFDCSSKCSARRENALLFLFLSFWNSRITAVRACLNCLRVDSSWFRLVQLMKSIWSARDDQDNIYAACMYKSQNTSTRNPRFEMLVVTL